MLNAFMAHFQPTGDAVQRDCVIAVRGVRFSDQPFDDVNVAACADAVKVKCLV